MFVVFASIHFNAATDEKIKQNRSVENFLSKFSFNPFTPFPEISAVTATTSASIIGEHSKQEDEARKKITKFPVFVAVEPTEPTTNPSTEVPENNRDSFIKKQKKISNKVSLVGK